MIENRLLLHCSLLGLKDGVEVNLHMGRASEDAPGYLFCVGRKCPPTPHPQKRSDMSLRAVWPGGEACEQMVNGSGQEALGNAHQRISTVDEALTT